MGVVYKAYERPLKRVVALKMLHSSFSGDASRAKRFRREAILAANLSHPNIVPIFQVDPAPSPRYFTMEFVQGCSLKERVEKAGFLSPDEATRIIAQAAEALQYAHEHNIVHRDVKPANILLQNHVERVRISDFGIAQDITGQLAEVTQTEGLVMGTPAFTSPEQNLGQKLDHRTDIFSLGMTFYYMLTGRVAYKARNRAELAVAFERQLPPPPGLLSPDVSEELDRVVMKMIATDPAQRHTSCKEIMNDLCKIAPAGLRPVAPLRSGAPAGKTARRYGVALAIAAILCAAVIWAVWPRPGHPPGTRRAPAPPPGARASPSTAHGARAASPAPDGDLNTPYTEARLADMPVAIHDFACSDVVGGKFYVFGGDRANDDLADKILVYDLGKDSWREAKGKMPYAYSVSGATNATAAWRGKIYISPGLGPRRNNGWGQKQRIIEFDPATETAAEKASFGAPVWCVSPVTFRNVIYWLGASGTGQEKKIWRYNPDRDSLTHVADLAGPGRSGSAVLGTYGRIYFFGGNDRREVDVFDTHRNTCVRAKELLPQRAGTPHAWPGPGNLIYLTRPMHNPAVWAFDALSGRFTVLSYAPSFAKESDAPGRAYDPDTGKVYFFGGRQRGVGERPLKATHVLAPNKGNPGAGSRTERREQ